MSSLPTITFRGILVVMLIGLVGAAAYVRNDSPGFTFAMQGIGLKIDSKAWYNGVSVPGATWAMKNLVPGADHFFNYPDVKPGDFGCNVISMHVTTGDAYLCMDFGNLKNGENGINEPESSLDQSTTTGELAQGLQFFGWVDNGDGKYQAGEKPLFGTSTKSASIVLNNKSYPLGDSKNGGSCKKNDTRYFATCWCAGALTVNLMTGKMSCDASTLGNAAQTDSMTLDVSIRAEPADKDAKFLCATSTTAYPPPPHKDHDDEEKCKGTNCGNINVINDNHGSVTSTTTSSSNTGGNSSGGGTTTTGTASSSSYTKNIINTIKTIVIPKPPTLLLPPHH